MSDRTVSVDIRMDDISDHDLIDEYWERFPETLSDMVSTLCSFDPLGMSDDDIAKLRAWLDGRGIACGWKT